MSFLEVEKLRVSDPLSEVTRRERRALLAVSAVSVAIVQTRLLPTKISALGIDFSSTDQNALLNLLALIAGYFVIAFVIYASSDFVAWRIGGFSLAYTSELEDYQRARQEVLSKLNLTPEQEEELHHLETSEGNMWRSLHGNRDQWASRVVPPVSTVRAIFEFILPVLIGIYAIISLILARP